MTMYITWLGQGCFKIEVKIGNEEVVIITDPFDPAVVGLKLPRTLTADLVLKTSSESTYPVEGREGKKPLIVSGPGEYEFKGVFVYAIPLKHEGEGASEYILRIEAEGMVLVHTGALNHVPEESELQEIEGVDVLFVPVGGGNVLDGKKAAELVSELEPRMVIPMMFSAKGGSAPGGKVEGLKLKAEGVEPFLKAVGAKSEIVAKLKLARKDLPSDDMKVVVLEKI